jgi:hypothetical protein
MSERSKSKGRLPGRRSKLGIAYMFAGALLMVASAILICYLFLFEGTTPGEAIAAAGIPMLLGLLLLLRGRRQRVQEGRLPGQRPKLGIAYMFVGALLMVAGAILIWYLFLFKGVMSGVAVLAGAIPMILGWSLFRRGRRHRVPVGQSPDDTRKPILFLRPFTQDGVQAYVHQTMKAAWAWTETGGRYEDMIRHAFRKMGPLLAIGKPGEKLPQTGAARLYFSRSDEQGWKQKVSELLADSQLALLQVGDSPGLAWEVEQAVATLASTPSCLVLCIPTPRQGLFGASSGKLRERRRKRTYQAFRKLHGSKFPKGLPEEIGCEQFICFDQDWTPRPPEWYGEPLPGKAGPQVTKALNWLSARLG